MSKFKENILKKTLSIGSTKEKEADEKSIVSVEISDEPRTDWRSIYVAAGLSFVGSAQFSLYFSALWPYLQTLDKTATEQFFGYIVAIYSVGQIISSPLFGYWSNKCKQVRLPLYVGLFLMLLGNIFYIALEFVPFSPKWLMLIGRFINGAGSGNVTLLRTYASTGSTLKDRPKAIAYATGGQALGMTCGPLFQLVFTPLGYPGFKLFSIITINLYTAPAYLACVMNIFGAAALKLLFKENYAGIDEASPETEGEAPSKLPMFDIIAVLVCYGTRFTQMFINTNLETIGSAFSMLMFDFSETKSVIFTSAAQGAIGVFTFLTYLAYILFKLENYVSARKACMTSLLVLIIFHLVTYSWPFIPGHVTMFNSTTSNETFGCNTNKFTWCQSLRPVNVYLYYIAYISALGFAFPIMNITTTTLFSKILGPRRQGTQQGWFQVSGGVARLIGPIVISILYTSFGPRWAWHLEIVVIGITLTFWCILYRRMISFQFKKVSTTTSASENPSNSSNETQLESETSSFSKKNKP